MTKVFCFIFLLIVSASSIDAQTIDTTAYVRVDGEVLKQLKLSKADIAAMSHVEASLKDSDGKSHIYRGVPVIDLLNRAGVTTGKELRGENLMKYVIFTCADGYQVVFALAELDPGFTDRTIVLADEFEGGPIPTAKGPFRLVVPGEKRPARSCQQVVQISVGFGSSPAGIGSDGK